MTNNVDDLFALAEKVAAMPNQMKIYLSRDGVEHTLSPVETAIHLLEMLSERGQDRSRAVVEIMAMNNPISADALNPIRPIKKLNGPAAYDYNEVVSYIERKYQIDIRNYDDGTGSSYDFWHYILDKHGDLPSDGSYIGFEETWMKDGAKPWQVKIADMFFAEFGEIDRNTAQKIVPLYVWW